LLLDAGGIPVIAARKSRMQATNIAPAQIASIARSIDAKTPVEHKYERVSAAI